jgi:trehalose utilization protein
MESPASPSPLRVTVWNEFRHERRHERIAAIYPDGIHEAIAAPLRANPSFALRTATLDEPDHGLGGNVLEETDVLLWWGHAAHEEVAEAITEAVVRHVHQGMGFIALHSAHFAKPFKRLMGAPCSLKWRDDGEKERLWTLLPTHPIAAGLGECFELAQEEMYGEPFGIPTPEELVFVSWFAGGEVFRSGATWTRGAGRVFYFRPGHETFPTYHDANVQRVIANAVDWARPRGRVDHPCPRTPALETR